jgi:hypothetical protein
MRAMEDFVALALITAILEFSRTAKFARLRVMRIVVFSIKSASLWLVPAVFGIRYCPTASLQSLNCDTRIPWVDRIDPWRRKTLVVLEALVELWLRRM